MELERELSRARSLKAKTVEKAFVSNEDASLRLFENPTLERLTKVHPATPLIIFVPVVLFHLWSAFALFGDTIGYVALAFFSGLIFWTFFEYVLHRFVFHFEPEKDGFFKRLHFLFHGIHHAYPRDSRRLVMPPTVGVPLALLVYLGLSKLMTPPSLAPFFAGFIFGYLCYDMMHFAMHHLNISNPLWQNVKKRHYLHHYRDNTKGFGVSSPLWDVIFFTFSKDI